MTGTMRVPRSRGAFSGVLLVLLGLWGALLPFVGPYAHFGFHPDETWIYGTDRLELCIAPGAATALGGLVALSSSHRALASLGGWLAALGGAWFVIGTQVAVLWDANGIGDPLGTTKGRHLAEQLTGFSALGAAIVFLSALALGRFAVVGVREAAPAPSESSAPTAEESDVTQPLSRPTYGRYARRPQHQTQPDVEDRRVAPDEHGV
ncbi:hypothetical protein [Actinomadura rupiterrae]|uniref:hypothetical protein n=1 Tax=Actinomadura rupiterrae TaxID=559627 RepID=UPI0020A56FBB|nr:hypothetical protein [Actinomadura rupiterrae]MCP2338138.1 hypothetical protein [Actinomadura rupiterrae]